ncbi:unnamed protein product [Rotaria sp. Silwood2]|nr:unnamed protein product [Rotaria sp. Silwood2]CAF4323583.1 unnamed protein product [Rotaria sp. Silwood2]
MGLLGSIMQVFILTTVSHYRKTPCMFYFIIASIHECGQFMTAYIPRVVAIFLNIDLTRISIVWCKIRYVFLATFSTIPLTFECLATMDQYLVTSQKVWHRQLSNMKHAYRASLSAVIIWWLHGTLWLYFQDMSPITGVCIYTNTASSIYTVVFICIIICGMHISIMMIFGILAYRNIRKTTALARLHADRHLLLIVFTQVLLTFVGLIPYTVYSAYALITINMHKNVDQIARETLAANVTYLFGSITYGGRFYLFMFSSSRFRDTVKSRILWWRREQRIVPLA